MAIHPLFALSAGMALIAAAPAGDEYDLTCELEIHVGDPRVDIRR